MPAPNPVKELIKRELLDRAPFGSYQERYELYDLFEKVPSLAATPAFRTEVINAEYLATSVDKRVFTADAACTVTKIDLTVTVAGTDGSAVTVMPEKVPSGTAIGSGSDLLASTLDLKGTANTIQNGTLHATAANLVLAAGDSIALDFAGTLTAATGVLSIQVEYGVEGASGLSGANPNWIISGTNAADADVSLDVDGGIVIATAGADNDQIIMSPRTGSQLASIEWEPEHSARVEWVLEIPTITTVLLHAGFGLTAALDLTTDDDQAKFQLSTEGAVSTVNWTAADSIAGTDVETDTDRVVEAATTVRLAVEINSNRVARFYVNGLLKHTSSALTAGVNLIPFIGVQALAVAVRNVKIRSVRVNRTLTAA